MGSPMRLRVLRVPLTPRNAGVPPRSRLASRRMPTLFSDKGSLAHHLAGQLANAKSAVESISDFEAVARDRDEWIDQLFQQLRVEPPRRAGEPTVEDLGRKVRDVTNRGGI